MATRSGGSGEILPVGESLKRALSWIALERRDRPDANLSKLVDRAALRFDLSPAEAEFLLRTLLSE